ncbi:MAG: hypothetical protein OXC11_02590 [Rhodospirillales bacterium]|nr:hypothetical protein [Rhodospirillales bacterium]
MTDCPEASSNELTVREGGPSAAYATAINPSKASALARCVDEAMVRITGMDCSPGIALACSPGGDDQPTDFWFGGRGGWNVRYEIELFRREDDDHSDGTAPLGHEVTKNVGGVGRRDHLGRRRTPVTQRCRVR